MKIMRHVYDERKDKIRDFWMGAAVVVAANVIMFVVTIIADFNAYYTYVGINQAPSATRLAVQLGPWGVNILFHIFFGWRRHWIALGGLAALASFMFVTLLFDMLFDTDCLSYFNPVN
jgi:hypothetical protein